MNESSQLEPIAVWMRAPNFFCCLEGVHNVGQIGQVRIGLVNQVIQSFQGLHDGGTKAIKTAPFRSLNLLKFGMSESNA